MVLNKKYGGLVKTILDTINNQFYITFTNNLAGGDVFVRKFEGTSSVNQEIIAGAERKISIYPNPAREILNYFVELDDVNIVTTDIYSTDGTFVKSIQHGLQNPGKLELSTNISGLSSGSYILQITIGSSKISKSFEIVK